MPTLRELRLQAGFSQLALAKKAGVDRGTVVRAEEGQPVQDVKAYAIVRAIAERTGKEIRLEDVTGLNII